MDDSGGPGSAQQSQPQQGQAPSVEQSVQSGTAQPGGAAVWQPPPGQPFSKSQHLRIIGEAVLAIVGLLGVILFLLHTQYSPPPIPSTPTTTVTAAFNQYALLFNRSNMLYGLPDAGAFEAYASSPTVTHNVLGATTLLFFAYQLNFTAPVYSSVSVLPPNYTLTTPVGYSGSPYPLGIDMVVLVYNSTASAARNFSKLYYNLTFAGAPGPAHNYTVGTYLTSTGKMLFNVTGNAAGMYRSTFMFNHTAIDGVPAVTETLAPIYANFKEYTITFSYSRYIVRISALGLNRTFDGTYLLNIARHTYAQIQASR